MTASTATAHIIDLAEARRQRTLRQAPAAPAAPPAAAAPPMVPMAFVPVWFMMPMWIASMPLRPAVADASG